MSCQFQVIPLQANELPAKILFRKASQMVFVNHLGAHISGSKSVLNIFIGEKFS